MCYKWIQMLQMDCLCELFLRLVLIILIWERQASLPVSRQSLEESREYLTKSDLFLKLSCLCSIAKQYNFFST